MSNASPSATHTDEASLLHQLQDQLLVNERHYRDLKKAHDRAQAKVATLAIDNQTLGHKNLILRAHADEAEKNLKDTQRELYRVDREAEAAKKEVTEARQGERQARKDTSIVLGEVERLNGVASGLMKELEEARGDTARKADERSRDEDRSTRDEVERLNGVVADLKESLSTYETILGAADTEYTALAEVARLTKSIATYERLLNTADRDLLAAQDEVEAFRARVSKLEGEVGGPPVDQLWQHVYRSEQYAQTGDFTEEYVEHAEVFSVCPTSGKLAKETRIIFGVGMTARALVKCDYIPQANPATTIRAFPKPMGRSGTSSHSQ